MKYYGVTVQTSEDSKFTYPQIYTNGQWKPIKCYVYTNNQWKLIGAAATQMLWFYDDDGKVVYTYNNEPFLVRDEYAWLNLADNSSNILIDNNNLPIMTY